ncbi:lipoyl(octanoyl) transferase LipB [soil metagenome]|nr:lipoyl(octanoyl) transferase LipB [Trueperaceae bacterium]
MRFEYVVRDLGRLPYRDAWDVQLQTHADVAEGRLPPTLLLVEHPPVITFGRGGGREHLLESEEHLRERGFDLVDVERGGDVTYHGPGQLVGYPIFPVGRRVRSYLRSLEAAMIRTFAAFGIPTYGTPGYAGVWAGDEKLVAIGVAIKRNVAFHGFAVNVHTDLAHFGAIVPCGLHDKGVTSLSARLGRHVTLFEVVSPLLHALREEFDPAYAALDASPTHDPMAAAAEAPLDAAEAAFVVPFDPQGPTAGAAAARAEGAAP